MKIFVCILGLLMATAAGAEEGGTNLYYLQLEFLKGDSVNYQPAGVRAACYAGSGKACDGTFWMSATSVGSTGAPSSDIQDSVTEIQYRFNVHRSEAGRFLTGYVTLIEIERAGEIVSGRRRLINRSIEIGAGNLVYAGANSQGDKFSINVRVQSDRPKELSEDVRTGPIVLYTRISRSGEQLGLIKNSSNRLEHSQTFRTAQTTSVEGGQERMEYRVKVTLDDYPDSSRYPMQTTVRIERYYVIDTLYVPGREFVSDVAYSSRHSKQVTLEPGRSLEIVIPPDTPSVRGFDVVDSLVIRPK
jgi:hypothetical protein